MVRSTVDVGFLRERRGGSGEGRAGEEGSDVGPPGQDRGLVGVLQGWKAALDALDQSHR